MKVVSIIGLVGLAGCVVAQDFGPIATRNERALSLPFLRFVPRSGVLASGEKWLDLGLTVSNDYKSFPGALEDQESVTGGAGLQSLCRSAAGDPNTAGVKP